MWNDGRYQFGFTPSGFFTLINKEGEPLYEQALPFFEKAVSHLVWGFFWVALILISNFFLSKNTLYWTDRFFMTMIILHLFLFGCRLTTLLLLGGLKPILFPPLWIKITRKLQKGGDLQLLTKYQLQNHPGLLINLALVQYTRKENKEAEQNLKKAFTLAPELSERFNTPL